MLKDGRTRRMALYYLTQIPLSGTIKHFPKKDTVKKNKTKPHSNAIQDFKPFLKMKTMIK